MQEFSDFTFSLQNNLTCILVIEKNAVPLDEAVLCLEEKDTFSKINNPARKTEFLLSRYLRNHLVGKHPICYKENGKPFLDVRGKWISISPSNLHLAFMLSSKPCAIDFEEVNTRARKVREKYLTQHELSLLNDSDIEFTRAWTIKEVLYKYADNKIQSYTEELMIESWEEGVSDCAISTNFEQKQLKVYTEQRANLIISFNFEPSI